MIRCVLVAFAIATAVLPSAAQMQRSFPATALRGELQVLQPPEAMLGGRSVRLAPGVRIRGEDNLIVLSGSLVQRRLTVHYTVDTQGQLQDVWVLTPAERANKPWPSTPAEAGRWTFDPIAQRWSK